MMRKATVAVVGLCLLLAESGVFVASDSNLRGQAGVGDEARELFFLDRTSKAEDSVCPPEGFDALKEFDFDSYISARWYIQKQIPVAYQTLDQFYCITADYTKDTNFCPLCNRDPRVDIDNRARQGSVDGRPLGGPSRFFRGIVRQPKKDPAKVTVSAFAAAFLPNPNYWIVAAGTYADVLNNVTSSNSANYDWAIVTGGSPTKVGANGKCLPDPGELDFLGMWMFARDPVPAAGVVDAIERVADQMGLDTSAWLPVAQEGCVYDY